VRPTRTSALVAAVALLLAACTGRGDETPEEVEPTAASQDLAVAVASYDLAVGTGQRLIAGLFTAERELLAFGEVTFELAYLGDEPGGEARPTQEVSASFLPVPGMEPEGASSAPTLLVGQSGTGVYAAEVDFDEPGYYGLRVTAELADGTTRTGSTVLREPVLAEPAVPAVGDEAPATVNHTLADVEAGRVAPEALDSRAIGGGEVPDPHLHDSTIADALAEGRPVVAIFSTPTFCVSRFCGPLVEVLADTATQYEDRADFIMVEVWEDFDDQQLNEAAAEWIQTETGGNEPWVFLIGEDGRIQQRWDNVLDLDELEVLLDRLPVIPPRAEGTAPSDLEEEPADEDASDDGEDAEG
jgi:hypothetical protein